MYYGKAAFNKDDFLEDMIATNDKDYAEWLLSENKRVSRNRLILYSLACLFMLLLMVLYLAVAVFNISAADSSAADFYAIAGSNFGYFIGASLIPVIGIVYCFSKISKNSALKKNQSKINDLYQEKYFEDLQSSEYVPTARPEELILEKSKICRAILRSKNKEEAEQILEYEKLWRSDFSLVVLGIFCISAMFGAIVLVIAYLIYYLFMNSKRKKDFLKAKTLSESRFANYSDSFSE